MENLERFNRIISGQTNEPFVIAEIGQAHDGSLGMAISLMQAAAKSGAHAVKFQTHFASEESSSHDQFRVPVFPQDKSRYDYWQRMEFTKEQWLKIAEEAGRLGIVFLSSPFSIKACEILQACDIPAWKIASGELENLPMLDYIGATNLPVLLSTGLASWDEIAEARSLFTDKECVLFQCTTQYPSQPETWGLNNVDEFIERFPDCVIGLSDHSGEIFPSIAAYARGARVFEVHVAWSKAMFGPDSTASLDFSQLNDLIRGLEGLAKCEDNPVDKDVLRSKNDELHALFGRSVFAARDIEEGMTLVEEDLVFLKPAIGIPAKHYKTVLGKRTNTNIAQGAPLDWGKLS